mmetsp:Transcript_87499/g.244905  ORF Transcript_87499/g.244905 Transcript_87499/m.244905 type:complete len:295 (-) Transcript_87499:295-1179(-)
MMSGFPHEHPRLLENNSWTSDQGHRTSTTAPAPHRPTSADASAWRASTTTSMAAGGNGSMAEQPSTPPSAAPSLAAPTCGEAVLCSMAARSNGDGSLGAGVAEQDREVSDNAARPACSSAPRSTSVPRAPAGARPVALDFFFCAFRSFFDNFFAPARRASSSPASPSSSSAAAGSVGGGSSAAAAASPMLSAALSSAPSAPCKSQESRARPGTSWKRKSISTSQASSRPRPSAPAPMPLRGSSTMATRGGAASCRRSSDAEDSACIGNSKKQRAYCENNSCVGGFVCKTIFLTI